MCLPGASSQEAIFHAVTRCVAAGFACWRVKGFLHTHNCNVIKPASGVLLPSWQPATNLLNGLCERGVHISNNIFLTLAPGVGVLALALSPVKP